MISSSDQRHTILLATSKYNTRLTPFNLLCFKQSCEQITINMLTNLIPLLALLALAPSSITASPMIANAPSQSALQAPSPHELFRSALLTDDQSSHIRNAMYEWKEDGFDLDLKEKRLIRFGEDEVPVWMTELEKIEAKAKGLRFMDM